jgi:hypothetical protein
MKDNFYVITATLQLLLGYRTILISCYAPVLCFLKKKMLSPSPHPPDTVSISHLEPELLLFDCFVSVTFMVFLRNKLCCPDCKS